MTEIKTTQRYPVRIFTSGGSKQATLYFEEKPVARRQRRFRERTQLLPEIDMADYVCTAVIDWIELRYNLARATQWKWVQRRIEDVTAQRCYVVGVGEGDDGVYRKFCVRLQEPKRSQILAVEKVIDTSWELTSASEISNLEISVDFRPRTPSEDSLAKMFATLVRCHLPSRDVMSSPRDRPRWAWKGGSRHVLGHDKTRPQRNDEFLLSPEHDAVAPGDATYYAGGRGARSMWRTMVKRIDRQNKSAATKIDLLASETRVRIEVTLREDELRNLGIETFADLQAFPVQKLQGRYFQFRCPTFRDNSLSAPGTRRAISEWFEARRRRRFLSAGNLGLLGMDQALERMKKETRSKVRKALGRPLSPSDRSGVGKNGTFVVHEQLTERVQTALRHLGERFASDRST